MRKYTKHLWLVAFLLLFFQLSAQVTRQYKPKKERTLKAQALEKEIQAFIDANINKYDLTPERVARLREDFEHEKKAHGDSQNYELSNLLLEAKKGELRKLYYSATTKSTLHHEEIPILADICDNGGFENGITDEYLFRFRDVGLNLDFDCDITLETLNLNPFIPNSIIPINDFNNQITLVNNDISVNDGEDPILSGYPNLNISRVHTGTNAIKLNNNIGGYGVTRMTKRFPVNSDFITFSYSLILQNPNPSNHTPIDQPHFMVRLYDAQHEIVSDLCIVADVSDTETFDSVVYGNLPLLYTGWQCGRLFTDGMENGEEATLEFIITDCGQGGHYGTVYIDDICVSESCRSVFPMVHLDVNPNVPNCPDFPIQVCGIFQLPINNDNPPVEGTLTTMTLNILQEGSVVGTVNTFTVDGNQFCFELDQSDFGNAVSGSYEYQAIGTFLLGTETVIGEDTSANIGPDAIFNNCIPSPPCPYCLTITTDVTTGTDNQQAYTCINADNTISGTGTEVVYRAGKEVVLLDGFDALYGTKDRFHIEGCTTNNYVARTAAPTKPVEQPKEITIDLIERTANSAIGIYPNPTSGELTVISGGASIKTLTVLSLEGKVILRQSAAEASSYQLNLNALLAGIYLLSVEGADGTVTSHKVIKN
ncbi:T9SS type A sorting domain-containing protein [Flavobacterium sp. Sd200]|uniref:T9SS type A sorting domain-containing protein n=1 Tax=Flavobacterium sp. Sd200 TaxID=2692211 RepID=UPI00136FF772|nr:T9SS type A sorting domain-containing protein [Flavobacterium sp. Sd200]MXN89985.1 T9SS type A sorting domain-containing protein [Flavobacterium sp. Sd200]